MTNVTIRDAIRLGLQEALDHDQRVFIMGEDVGQYGGAYAVTKGFLETYGDRRIKDTPISESVIVGAGVGAALAGLRPVVEIMTINFSLLAMDQIVNHAAKLRYMSAGQFTIPLIIRTVTGGGAGLGATHSQNFEGMFASIPGLKVVIPSDPYDALGLIRTALKDDNPIIFAEHALLYSIRGDIPQDYYTVPFGESVIRREGADLTIATWGRMVGVAVEAADTLSTRGIATEVIDLRTLRPIDLEGVVKSVRKTGRCLVLEEGWSTGGFGGYLAGAIQEAAFDYLDGPVIHMGGLDVPTPYSEPLEALVFPTPDRVVKETERLIKR